MHRGHKRRRLKGFGAAVAILLALGAGSAAPAGAASDPLFFFSPQPPPPPAPPEPAPTGFFNGPCGLAIDGSGDFWVSDHYHRAIDLYSTTAEFEGQPLAAFGQPEPHTGALDDPCGLGLDSSETLYVNNWHRNVARFPSPHSLGTASVLAGSAGATGVAVGPEDEVYVDARDAVSVYDSSGTHLQDIGATSLEDGYGIAVSGFGATEGFVYVADAQSNTVKVYDPETDTENPVLEIDGSETAAGQFSSLVDAALAVDDATGDVYVTDNVQPTGTERPQTTVHVFDAAGEYQGHLKRNVLGGAPNGLAVDNSPAARHPAGTQGRVYVTNGNTHRGGVYVYPPEAAVSGTLQPPAFPPPLGSAEVFPTVSIGEPASAGRGCEGDSCQSLEPPPGDPTLTTLLAGRGNPKVRYVNAIQNCGALARRAKRLARSAKRLTRRAKRAKSGAGAMEERARKLRRRAKRKARAARRCRGAAGNRSQGRASASASAAAPSASAPTPVAGSAPQSGAESVSGSPSPSSTPTAQGLFPGTAGFDAVAVGDGGGAATLAGSHPYAVELSVGLDQGGGDSELRELDLRLPPGLILNPANLTGVLCPSLGGTRSTPFGASESGENCPDRSQVGTIEATTDSGGGQTRRFGLFNLEPKEGEAARYGAAPFGKALVFSAELRSEGTVAYTVLESDVSQGLELQQLDVNLWGTPWAASHDAQRGDCLNEAEPGFGHAKCSIGDPASTKPLAFLTLPTRCGEIAFTATVRTWQESGTQSRTVASHGSGGEAVPLTDCANLAFKPEPEALLTVKKASSGSGFFFRFTNEDENLTDPDARVASFVKRMEVELPDGVTLNPSIGAGLGTCSESEFERETAFNAPGEGCPNASKIGIFSAGLPYYRDRLRGSAYLAEPKDNPFGELIAVYLVAKSADRGMIFKIPVELEADSDTGDLVATVDDLPQLPYIELEVNFRSGQRAALVSPPHCGDATTELTLTPWAQGAGEVSKETDSPIERGSNDAPCPSGTPPFEPDAIAGGVNSNVNSYTPYYVHLIRQDTEQEITSYSLVLPKGITGKLAGIPFCPEALIAAARSNGGVAELKNPSCPAISQVGRTLTGYGVGDALTYADGRIFLAGPYKGAPLSLVTVNSAVVGPFDLGTVVVRSGFQVDPLTAQLRIDSSISDPIPHIIEGIPLHLRDVRVFMDRPEFTHNPSSCEPSALISTLGGSGARFDDPSDDSLAHVSKHFQLLNCLTLGFSPKLGMRLRGRVTRGGYPALRATFAARGPQDSNLKRIEVNMPRQLFLAQNHIRTVCTRVQFAAGACPPGSVYGSAVAHTPLLDEPLRGKVYLRSSDNKLPDLVTSLFSGEVRIDLVGRIGPTPNGGIQAFFDNLPDAPVDRFTMFLRGGKQGLLTNSVNICKQPPLASIKALGQNNRGSIFATKLRGQCDKKGKGNKKGKGKGAKNRRGGKRR
jgi:hypothetical protein